MHDALTGSMPKTELLQREHRTQMRYASLNQFIAQQKAALAKGPIAIVLVEDDVEVDTTLRHHQQQGFAHVLALMPAVFELPRDLTRQCTASIIMCLLKTGPRLR